MCCAGSVSWAAVSDMGVVQWPCSLPRRWSELESRRVGDLLSDSARLWRTGEIAQSYVACLAACGGKVSCVFDADTARAAAIVAPGSAAEGATVCATLEELLSSEQVTVVLNLTPVAAHAPVSRAALERGKHVWSEKPLAPSAQQARELVELAARRRLQLGCSPLTFWGEAQQTLARHIQQGLIGTVRLAQVDLHCGAHSAADWNQHDPLAFNLGGWTRHPRMQVGSMVDVGVYAIALLTALLGPVAHVSSATPHVQAEGGGGCREVWGEEHQMAGVSQLEGPHEGHVEGVRAAGGSAEAGAAGEGAVIDLYCVTLVMRSGAVAQVLYLSSADQVVARWLRCSTEAPLSDQGSGLWGFKGFRVRVPLELKGLRVIHIVQGKGTSRAQGEGILSFRVRVPLAPFSRPSSGASD